MDTIPLIQLGFTAFQFGYPGQPCSYVHPLIQFQDKGWDLVPLSDKLEHVQRELAANRDSRYAAEGLTYWLCCVKEAVSASKEQRLISLIKSKVTDLLQNKYRSIELKVAWPNGSSPLMDLAEPWQVGRVMQGVIEAKDLHLRVLAP